MRNDSPILPRIILGILAAILLGTFYLINLHSQHQIDTLKKTAIHTDGFVSGKNCSNHGAIHFSYGVDGKEFSHLDALCAQIDCEKAKVGDPVSVIYSSTNPQLSVCNDFSSSETNISSNFLLLIIASIVISIVINRITKNTK